MHTKNSDFRIHVTGKVNEFKRVYRSNIPFFTKAKISIKEMSIDRKSIKNYSDKQLYTATYKMVKHIQTAITDEQSPLYEHKGLAKFTDEISTVLNEYIEINNTIIHSGKYASRIYMSLIQEIHSIMQNKSKEINQSILSKINHLNEINHIDTLKSLNNALENIKETDINLYCKLKKVKQKVSSNQ